MLSNAKNTAGGFVGKQDTGIQMTNCFYDNEVTATVEGFDYAPTSYCAKTATSPTLSNVPSTGYTAAVMKSAASYAGFGSTVWTIKDGEYPALAFESAGASEEPEAAKIDKVSLTLEGNIALNFYTTFKKADVQSVTYTLNGAETTLAETTWKEKTESNAEYLIFSCPVPAKNYSDQVTLKITGKDNKVTEGNYSVKDYADYIEEHKDDYAAEYPLISAMVDYCEQARKYFAAEAVSEDFSAEYDRSTFTSYQATAEGTLAEGIEITQTSLVLESETTIKIYLTSTVALNVTGCKVVDLGNNRYCIRIENISAKDLDKAFTIVINGTYTITYSAFSYAYSAYGIESLALTNVMEAMYAYNQAANEYFGA